MPGGFDVVLHVADEHRFLRQKPVFRKNFVNLHPLVPDREIGPLQEFVEAVDLGLRGKVIVVHGAQEEGP